SPPAASVHVIRPASRPQRRSWFPPVPITAPKRIGRDEPGHDIFWTQRRPIASRSADLFHHLGELVDAVSRTVAADNVVVAQPVQVPTIRVGWMHDDVHVLLDGPRLVAADQRPFDEVVALAVAIEPRFFRPTMLAHERVEGF